MNEEHAMRYAQLLVKHGVDLRRNQPLYIHGQVAHRHLVALLTEVAYEMGSGPVETRLFNPLQEAALIRHGRLEDIELCHSRLQAWYDDLVRYGGAYICLVGLELPDMWDELERTHPRRRALYDRARNTACGGVYRHVLDALRCAWVAAPCPTVGWARKVFPELSESAAFDRLAELIFRFTFADRENVLELDAARDQRLKARCRRLDELAVTQIHVTGVSTDLRVGFSRQARWQGGSLKTSAGQRSAVNLPTEEVFTTPDKRLTQGRLAVTSPFRLRRGPLVRDLVLTFHDGRVVDFDAGSGRESFSRWLDTHEGARYLGEFALVGQDSAIARSGLFFDLVLLDENASAHVALGRGYASALEIPPLSPSGGTGDPLSSRELEELGCNQSAVHTDILFGSPETTIVATGSREGEVVLVDRGEWADRFAGDSRG